VASADAGDNTLQTSITELGTVEFIAAPVASEATTITVPVVPTMTSALTEPATGLVSAPSELALNFVDIIRTTVERGFGSATTEAAPAMDIMEELAYQIVQQFFTSMRSYIELVLSGRSSFEFVWMLLENHIENIRHTRSSEQGRAYLTLVEQLGICLKKLRTLEKTSPMDEARLMLNKLLTAQKCEKKEIEEQMIEEARHLHDFQASYQRLVDNSRESEVATKNAEQVITTARAAIAKAQVLIQVNEQKLAAARKRLEELEATKKRVQEDLVARSSCWPKRLHSPFV